MTASIVLIKTNPKVEFLDDESAIGNGYLVTLKRGWTWEPGTDNRMKGFSTRTAALIAIRCETWAHDGPYDP